MTATGWFTGGKLPHQVDYDVTCFDSSTRKSKFEFRLRNGRKGRKTGFVEPTQFSKWAFFNQKLYFWAGEHSYSGYTDIMACQNLGNWFRLENIRFTQNGDEINSR